MANNLMKGAGEGTCEWREDFVLTDTDQTSELFKVVKSTGDVSVAGDLVVTGSITGGSVIDSGGDFVFNEDGASRDARFEGDTATHLLFLDGSADKIGVKNSTPSATLDVTGSVAVSSTLDVGGLLTSSVAAGSPVFKVILTNDTPTVAFTDDGSAAKAPTTAPAGYLEIIVGSTPYYIPVWA